MKKFKFVAIGLIQYVIPYVRRNDDGVIVENRSIVFEPGSRGVGKITPAYFNTMSVAEAEYLREYPTFNEDFKEVKAESEPVKKSTPPTAPKKVVEKTPEPVEDVSFDDDEDLGEEAEEERELTVYEEVSTVQQAVIMLKKLDKNLKNTDVNSKQKVLAMADIMNVSFPGLN